MRLGMIIICSIGFIAALYLGLGVLFSKAHAQGRSSFPIGVPVQTQALFCFDRASAQIIADNKGEAGPETEALVNERKCILMHILGTYVREVYQKGQWSVWEIKTTNSSLTLFEATNWTGYKPLPRGYNET